LARKIVLTIRQFLSSSAVDDLTNACRSQPRQIGKTRCPWLLAQTGPVV
jgi:hypothetical protein